tara:strand:- start:731 stop:1633 length:903 start_codon:yes stop_codon:yes gene_type:complete
MFYSSNLIKNGNSFVILKNIDESTLAKINLNQGGRLEELKFSKKTIIKEIESFKYSNSYASSILFPFSSRVENGVYHFNGNTYQLECNDDNRNALHGLIYNKIFKIEKISETPTFSSVTISYLENKKAKGFPFLYKIQLTYILYKDDIKLIVKIENTDNSSFPYTIGWHPYFFCNEDLHNSLLRFDSNQKIQFDKSLITKKVIQYLSEKEFKIGKKKLDDCFILNSDTIAFLTPKYHIEIATNQIENYLQIYTPKDLPLIAIEPMTGISNSFNNKIGLQVLEPNQSYSISWNIKLKTKKQ